jgi:hypothetical protein
MEAFEYCFELRFRSTKRPVNRATPIFLLISPPRISEDTTRTLDPRTKSSKVIYHISPYLNPERRTDVIQGIILKSIFHNVFFSNALYSSGVICDSSHAGPCLSSGNVLIFLVSSFRPSSTELELEDRVGWGWILSSIILIFVPCCPLISQCRNIRRGNLYWDIIFERTMHKM